MLRFARTMKKEGGRKWENFLADAFEFRKNERECDEHVGAEGNCVRIEAESNCATTKEATIIVADETAPSGAGIARGDYARGWAERYSSRIWARLTCV